MQKSTHMLHNIESNHGWDFSLCNRREQPKMKWKKVNMEKATKQHATELWAKFLSTKTFEEGKTTV